MPMSLVSFEPHWFTTAAAMIRGDVVALRGPGTEDDMGPGIGSFDKRDVLAWLDAMSHFCDGRNVHHWASLTKSGKLRAASYKMESLLLLTKVSGLVKNDHKIRDLVETVGVLLKLPPKWMDDDSMVPSPSTLCKSRFTLDMAYNVLCRDRLSAWLEEGTGLHIAGLWDSSPRDGREWMLGELYIMRDDDLNLFCECMDKLMPMMDRVNISGAEEKDCMAKMAACMWHIILTASCLGAKAMSLADKWHSAVFQLRMLSFSWEMVQALTRAMINVCSDLGTESSLTKPEFDCNKLYPWWSEDRIIDDVADTRSSFAPATCSSITLSRALPTMGLEHICHNAEEHVVRNLPSFKKCFLMASNIGKFIAARFCKGRMQATIFNREGAEWIARRVSQFSEVPYEKRFGTLVSCCEKAHPLRKELQRFWDDRIWGDGGRDINDDEDADWVDTSQVSAGILSPWFWSYMVVIMALATVFEELRRFSRSCPCHKAAFDRDGNIMTYRKRVKQREALTGLRKPCPAKGLLAPWLACGKAREIMHDAVEACQRMMLASFDVITAEERNAIVNEYEGAAAIVVQQFDYKVEGWEALPLRICALGNPDQDVARQGMRWCLDQFQNTKHLVAHHERVIELFDCAGPFESPLQREMKLFLAGRDLNLNTLPLLKQYGNSLRLVRCNEISVERLHRLAVFETSHATNIGPAFVSYGMRATSCFRGPFKFPLDEVAIAAENVRQPNKCLEAFGLTEHPAKLQADVQGKSRAPNYVFKQKLLTEICYHADNVTLYDPKNDLKDAIKKHNAKVKAESEQAAPDPLGPQAPVHDSEESKMDAVLVKYAFRHFKDCANECKNIQMYNMINDTGDPRARRCLRPSCRPGHSSARVEGCHPRGGKHDAGQHNVNDSSLARSRR